MTTAAATTTPGPTPVLDEQICFALYNASRAVTARYRDLLTPLGLTYPQYLTMMVLWERDGMTVGEISTRLLTDPGSLTPLLKRLEAEGLLSRTRSKDDERVVIVELTPQGRALRDQAESVPLNIVKASCHSSAELRALQASLLSLRKNLQQGL